MVCESCVTEKNTLLCHIVSQILRQNVSIQSIFFDCVCKSVDTNGVSSIAFSQGPRLVNPSGRLMPVTVWITHMAQNQRSVTAQTEARTHTYLIKKKKKNLKSCLRPRVKSAKIMCTPRHFNDTMWIAVMAAKRPAVTTTPVHNNSGNAFLLWI